MEIDSQSAPLLTRQAVHAYLDEVRGRFRAHPLGPSPAPRRLRRITPGRGGGRGRGGGARSWFGPARKPAAGRIDGELVYAIGDLHGRRDLLEMIVDQIVQDAAGRPHSWIFLGDYVDRGPDSAGVMEFLLCLRRRLGESLCLLKGNHEQALERFIADPGWGAAWLDRFGGAATLRSYGVTPPGPEPSVTALAQARDRLLENMPASHLRLLSELDHMVVVGDYAFVHAGICPDTPLAEQSEDDLLWVRDGFVDAPGPFEKIIVHGHTWQSQEPVLLEHRIGVDTGAYETGVLTAIRLEDGRRAVIQALDEEASRRRVAPLRPPPAPMLVSRPADYLAPASEQLRTLVTAPALNVNLKLSR